MQRRNWLVLVAAAVLVVGAGMPVAQANTVFGVSFNPNSMNITKPGEYNFDVTIDPYYQYIGYVITVDATTKPQGVFAVVMPPAGFATDASVNHKARLLVIVLPNAPQTTFMLKFNVKQIVPPYGTSTISVAGPTLSINFPW